MGSEERTSEEDAVAKGQDWHEKHNGEHEKLDRIKAKAKKSRRSPSRGR